MNFINTLYDSTEHSTNSECVTQQKASRYLQNSKRTHAHRRKSNKESTLPAALQLAMF